MADDFVSPYTGMNEKDWLGHHGWMKGRSGSGMFLGPENVTTTALPQDLANLYYRYYGEKAQQQPAPVPQPAPNPAAPAPVPAPAAAPPAAPQPQQPQQQMDLGGWVGQLRNRFQNGGSRQSAFGQQGGQGWGWGDFLSNLRRQ